MNRHLSLIALSLLACAARAELPTVSGLAIRQNKSCAVVIDYTLAAGEGQTADACIVTLALKAGETAIPSICLTNVLGDVNRVIQPGARHIFWQPGETAGDLGPLSNLSATLSVWATNAAPPYMVCNLETFSADDIRYYPDAESIPGGVTNDLYKTSRLVMRRIPAAGVTWRAGNTTSAEAAIYHYVTFTEDYWVGVFETTLEQLRLAWGYASYGNLVPSAKALADHVGTWPHYCTQFHGVRGAVSKGVCWPESGYTNVTGHVKTLRNKTGLQFDIPTAAEWEYACRAGQATVYNNGTTDAEGGALVAWCKANSEGHPHPVGEKPANNWGLYDLHGNVAEWVQDRVAANAWYTGEPATDPLGPSTAQASSTNRRYMGGSYLHEIDSCRAISRGSNSPGSDTLGVGFRLWLPANPFQVKLITPPQD